LTTAGQFLRGLQNHKTMKKTVITFGLISGVIIVTLMFATMPLHDIMIEKGTGELVGYTTMVISLSMIFFGIKSYRDRTLNGVISFGKALQVGLLITLIASLSYAAGWEVYLKVVSPNFMEEFASIRISRAQSEGMPAAELKALREQMDMFTEMYKNPAIRFGMTLMEIVPVGLLISLLASALLRKKNFVPQNA
jgi:hypothetical protein